QVDRVFQRFSAQEKDSENSTSILFLSDASLCRVFSFLDVPSGALAILLCTRIRAIFEGRILQRQFGINVGFGSQDWKKYFGNVGEVPPLPSNIGGILRSPCPFWPDKRVGETHILTLIPKTVNRKPFTLNGLQELIQNPREKTATDFFYYSRLVQQELGDAEVEKTYWVLMTTDVIPDSRSKTYEEQKQLVKQKKAEGYELPSALEAAASILMCYFKTDEYTYESTYTRCRETVTESQFPVIIGGFARGGLVVDANSIPFDYDYCGVAGVRKL
ncbi:MAG: hypothetical protein ACR2QC_08550, partial [Gammaproteobacteria bacterium]